MAVNDGAISGAEGVFGPGGHGRGGKEGLVAFGG